MRDYMKCKQDTKKQKNHCLTWSACQETNSHDFFKDVLKNYKKT